MNSFKKKFSSLFNKKENSSDLNKPQFVASNNGLNQNNQDPNSLLLYDLSLAEKNYLERELDFKYDATKFKVLKINRTNKDFLEVQCEININNQKQIVTERILYKNIKNDLI
ncbi:MAG: hypothetical protein HUJ42_00230 [Malacoplasma sp.]|nr:hypothetical protein [Malacoplasma sp.]